MKNKDELLEEYRKLYTHYNDETLKTAVVNHRDLVKEIIQHPKVNDLARAFGLHNLGEIVKSEEYEFIKSYLNDGSPLMREASARCLCDYYCEDKEKYSEVRFILEAKLLDEKGPGVIKKITNLLDYMNRYA